MGDKTRRERGRDVGEGDWKKEGDGTGYLRQEKYASIRSLAGGEQRRQIYGNIMDRWDD